MILKLPVVLVVGAIGAFVVAGATGCTRAKAKTTPDVPTLDMPAPPPRDIEKNESEPPPPMPLPQEPTRNTPARPRPQPAAPAPRANEPVRTEPPKSKPPPATEPPPIVEKPPRPAQTLKRTPAQADVEVERTIRATMTKAANDLNRID